MKHTKAYTQRSESLSVPGVEWLKREAENDIDRLAALYDNFTCSKTESNSHTVAKRITATAESS